MWNAEVGIKRKWEKRMRNAECGSGKRECGIRKWEFGRMKKQKVRG